MPDDTFVLTGSCGSISVGIGWHFEMDECIWQIVQIVGSGMYSPGTLGGTPTLRCKLIAGDPDGRYKPNIKNGHCDLCGDSIASAILAPLRYGGVTKRFARIAALEAQNKRLGTRLSKIAHAPVPETNAIAMALKGWAFERDGEPPYPAQLAAPAGMDELVRAFAVTLVDGVRGYTIEYSSNPRRHEQDYDFLEEQLGEWLAAVIQPIRAQAVAEERERCAAMCEQRSRWWMQSALEREDPRASSYGDEAGTIAAAIRSGGGDGG